MISPLTRDQFLVELEKLRFPMINYRRTAYFGYSVIDFWGLAMGLYMCTVAMCSWVNYESPSLSVFFWFAGICLYIHGIFNWYQGRSILSTLDFIFGLLFLTIYYTAELGKYGIYVPYEYRTYMQGVFYIVFLIVLMFLLIGMSNRGSIYTLNLYLIILGVIFVLMWDFSKETWARKLAGYAFLCAAITTFVTGLGRLLSCLNHINPYICIQPYL